MEKIDIRVSIVSVLKENECEIVDNLIDLRRTSQEKQYHL